MDLHRRGGQAPRLGRRSPVRYGNAVGSAQILYALGFAELRGEQLETVDLGAVGPGGSEPGRRSGQRSGQIPEVAQFLGATFTQSAFYFLTADSGGIADDAAAAASASRFDQTAVAQRGQGVADLQHGHAELRSKFPLGGSRSPTPMSPTAIAVSS